jgi:hypothetical protein
MVPPASSLDPASNEFRSDEVKTCFTVAPVECVTAADPASPLEIVKVSPEGPAVIKTISSLVVSGSIATVNCVFAVRVTPPRRVVAVPVATVILVTAELIVDASVVSTLTGTE